MKVTILTEGGGSVGLGHVSRCVAVYEAFEELDILPMLVVNGDESISALLEGKNWKLVDWLNDGEGFSVVVNDADIVFVDSYLADYSLYENISNTSKTAAYFDDDMRLKYPKGFVVNGAILAEKMPYLKIQGVNYLLGVEYAPLKKDFWDAPARQIRPDIETIMVTLGGTDVRGIAPEVLKQLAWTHPSLRKRVIIAKGYENTDEIQAVSDDNTELVYYPNASEMRRVMLDADIAISACGQTLCELARLGTPTIGICIADNQSQNVSGWLESGFLTYLGRYDEAGLIDRLGQTIDSLNSQDSRAKIAQLGQRIIDGQGCKRLVDQVLKSINADR